MKMCWNLMKINRKNHEICWNWQENLKFDDNLLKFVEIYWNLMHCYQKSLEIRWNLLKIDRKIRDLMKICWNLMEICWKLTGKWKKWMKICWNLWKFWMRNWSLWWCGVEDLLKRSWCKLGRFRIKLGADHLQHSITVRGSLFFVQQDRQWCRDPSLSPSHVLSGSLFSGSSLNGLKLPSRMLVGQGSRDLRIF